MTEARDRARRRREQADEADKAYGEFLDRLATPIARQVVNALRAEGYAFTVATPGRGLRITSDHGRDDFVEVTLATDGDVPEVVGRVRRTRGSRTIEETRPVRGGVPPQELTEDDVLEFLMQVLGPWLER
jgi:hypothetical protein